MGYLGYYELRGLGSEDVWVPHHKDGAGRDVDVNGLTYDAWKVWRATVPVQSSGADQSSGWSQYSQGSAAPSTSMPDPAGPWTADHKDASGSYVNVYGQTYTAWAAQYRPSSASSLQTALRNLNTQAPSSQAPAPVTRSEGGVAAMTSALVNAGIIPPPASQVPAREQEQASGGSSSSFSAALTKALQPQAVSLQQRADPMSYLQQKKAPGFLDKYGKPLAYAAGGTVAVLAAVKIAQALGGSGATPVVMRNPFKKRRRRRKARRS